MTFASGVSQPSVGEIMKDARLLVGRLLEGDRATEGMVNHGLSLSDKIASMKVYRAEIHEMESVVPHRPRTAIVHSLQQENKQIRELREENRELKLALEEYQSAIDLIMQRHREQMIKMMQVSHWQQMALGDGQRATTSSAAESAASVAHTDKMLEMAVKFEECLRQGEQSSQHDQLVIAQLNVENVALRQLLDAHVQNDATLPRRLAKTIEESRSPKPVLTNGGPPLVNGIKTTDDKRSMLKLNDNV